MFVFLLAVLLAYQGEIDLSVRLATPGGKSFGPGKFQVEIRRQGQDYVLAFLSNGQLTASIASAPATSLPLGIPIAPAILLWPPPAGGKSETRSKLSPYLTDISWEATLRLYRSVDPSRAEARAVVRVPGKRLEFPLFVDSAAAPR